MINLTIVIARRVARLIERIINEAGTSRPKYARGLVRAYDYSRFEWQRDRRERKNVEKREVGPGLRGSRATDWRRKERGVEKYFNIRQSPWLETRKLGPTTSHCCLSFLFLSSPLACISLVIVAWLPMKFHVFHAGRL